LELEEARLMAISFDKHFFAVYSAKKRLEVVVAVVTEQRLGYGSLPDLLL